VMGGSGRGRGRGWTGKTSAPPGEEGASSDSGRGRLPAGAARRVRLVVLDVDGVLTDAGVYLGATTDGTRVELKRFDIQDGLGVRLLREAGIRVAIVSGRPSEATRLRAEELGIEDCIQEPGGLKLPALSALLQRRGIEWEEVAMLGDDLPDLPVMRKVGLPAAVGNAVAEVRKEAVFTTRRDGGRGAVREFARVLLEARGEWLERVEAYCAARSED
jgi:3-deoxy-D-manno-octulosonate 8-phosphate phosphatase (KDO 8-P phosphatase)